MVTSVEDRYRPQYESHAWRASYDLGKVEEAERISVKKEYSLITKCAAEFFGDLIFVFVGTMQANGAGDGVTHAALAHGLTIFLLATAIGHISGGHFNPAVSWAAMGAGKLKPLHFPFYAFSQILGGFCGALLTASILSNQQLTNISAGATLLSADSLWWQGLIAETLATFILVHTVLITAADDANVTLAPLAIGLSLGVAILAVGPITRCSANPARSLGPNLVYTIFIGSTQAIWNTHYIYYAGPLAGSTIALVVFKLFESRETRLVL